MPSRWTFKPTRAPEFADVLHDQLTDIRTLLDDANDRGWNDEIARHERVITPRQDHLRRLDTNR